MRIDSIEKLSRLRKKSQKELKALKKRVLVCLGPGCLASGSDLILEEFQKIMAEKKLKDITITKKPEDLI